MKETKIVCPKCGAEFDVVAGHQHMATGMVVGKDSGLGTIYLPTKDGKQKPLSEATMQQKMQLLSSMGFDVKSFVSMAQSMGMRFSNDDDALRYDDDNKEQANVAAAVYDEVEENIRNGNWLENAKLFRRFLPAHTLRLLFGSDWGYNKNGKYGRMTGDHFTQWLHSQPDMYEWKVVINEFHAMAAMKKHGDKENLYIRSLIWNKDVVIGMLNDYMATVEDFVKTSKVKTYKKKSEKFHGCYTYERVKYYKFHGIRNYITVDELDAKVYKPIRKAIEAVVKAKKDDYGKIEKILTEFKEHVQIMPRRYNETRTFANAFKAAGGYYTLEDFIRHNGWRITPREHVDGWGKRYATLDREESLEFLRGRLENCAKYDGYRLIGLLKQVAEDNHFDYEATRAEWAAAKRKKVNG